MSKILTDSDLTYTELNAKYYADKPVDRENITAMVAEIRDWRELGSNPADVRAHLEELEWDLNTAQDEAQNLEDQVADLKRELDDGSEPD